MTKRDTPVPHGVTRYNYYGCRCRACRDACNLKQRNWYRQRKAAGWRRSRDGWVPPPSRDMDTDQ